MSIALRLGSDGSLEGFAPAETLEIDIIDRRSSGNGDLEIGPSLGALDSLVLGSSTTLIESLGDFHVQNVVFEDQAAQPTVVGEITQDSGSLYARDSTGVFNLRQGGSVTTFADDVFRIQDNGDNTKQIAFQASGITTATTRTITVPDVDITIDGNTSSRPPNGSAGGGLGGTYPNPTVNGMTSGVLSNDTAHGNRGNGSLHSVATTSVAGFMSAADKTKLDGISSAVSLLFAAEQDFGNIGSNTTLNFTALKAKLTVTGSCTLTPGTVPSGVTAAHFQLRIYTGSGGNFVFMAGVNELPNTVIQIPLASSTTMFVNLYYDGSTWWAQAISE